MFLAIDTLCYMIEVIGCIPKLQSIFSVEEVQWLKELSYSPKEEVQEHSAVLYALIISQRSTDKEFENIIEHLIQQCLKRKIDTQHGAILMMANCLERMLFVKKNEDKQFSINVDLIKKSIFTICK